MDVIARRPFLLSIVTILMILSGILSVIAGIALVALHNDDTLLKDTKESPSTLTTLGIIGIVFGLIHIWLAMGLRRGSRFARFLVGLFEFVQIAAAIWGLIALSAQYRVQALVTIVVGLFVLWYLYAHQPSRAFFAR